MVAGTCVRLGLWQLDRLEQRRAGNSSIRVAGALPVLELDSAAAEAVRRTPGAFLHRRVRARGIYTPAGEIVLRGRAREGRPGVHLVTPFRLAGSGTTVLVERGWAPSPDALSLDTRPLGEPGVRTVAGLLQEVPSTGNPGAVVRGTVIRLDLPAMRRGTTGPVLPLYIRQLAPPSGISGLERLPPPELGQGSHLSYAVQWFSFAAITLLGFAAVVLKRSG